MVFTSIFVSLLFTKMNNWFTKKSKLEKLQERYTYLMRRSFETALNDTDKSEEMHRQADRLLQEIQYLSLQHT